jgi:hypothetical protein
VADLTTTDGQQISFDPAAVAAVADRDADTGAAVTCVYGLSPGVVKIPEPVSAFLGRLGIVGKFARLTRPDGSPVWIDAAAVSLLRAPLPGEYPPNAKCVIRAGALTQAVTEDPATASAAIQASGGHLGARQFRRAIAADLRQRIAVHQARIAQEAQHPTPGRKLNLLADGDSWFDYPLTGETPFVPSDIVAQLRTLLTPSPFLLSLAQHGDATTQLMGVSRRNCLIQQLNDPKNGRFDAILFSGGGNDLVGDQFRLWLQDAAAAGNDPSKALDQLALSDILGVVMTAYQDLLAVRDARDHSIPVVVHAYDFALPTDLGVCGYGPWLFPSLQSRGWLTDTSAGDVAKGASIVKLILIEFEKLMRALAADPSNNVIYIETQGMLAASDWANELHPTPEGFRKIARLFVGPLNNLLAPPPAAVSAAAAALRTTV